MPARLVVSPRLELFLAFAEVVNPAADETLWLRQSRRKLDQATRRRLGDLAINPSLWLVLAGVPGAEALEGDTDAVIAALADLPADDFMKRARSVLPSVPDGLQQAAVDALRRFDRVVFAAFWRRAQADLQQAARNAAMIDTATIVYPTMFGEHRYTLGNVSVATAPIDRLVAPQPVPAPTTGSDPEAVFRALGDTTRYAIARLIAIEPLTGAELARRLGVSGPTLTHHLKQLRLGRLVIEERRGNSIVLRLDRGTIETLSAVSLDNLFGKRPVPIRRSRKG